MAIFPVNIKFGLLFSRIIECDRPQGTNYNGPQGIVTSTVEDRINSATLIRLLKTQIFDENFSEKELWAYFVFILTNRANVSKQLLRAHEVSSEEISKLYDHFLRI